MKKLYYYAYRFLKLRATGKDPFKALENLKYKDQEKVKHFLSFNHQIKFI